MAIYQKIKGSVGYNIIGTPTVVNGIASNFSGTSYLQTSASQTETITSFEWNFKFNTGTLSTEYNNYLLGFNGHGGIYVTGGKIFRVTWVNNDGSWVEKNTNYQVANDTIYTVNIKLDNTTETCIVTIFSESGSVLFTETYTSVTGRRVNSWLWIGMRGDASLINNYWRGSIDLNESYIKINGQPWFGLCPLSVNHIQLRGPIGYTVTGSPTVSNGVASGFSSDDYLEFYYGTFPTQGVKIYEAFIKLTTGNDVSGFQGVFGSVNYNGASFGLRVVAGYRWDCTLPYKKASDGTLGTADIFMSKTIQANTTYYVKIKQDFEVGTNKLSVSTDNVNFTEETVTASDYGGIAAIDWWRLGVGKTQTSQVFLGSVDLNETYVKLDGKLWFWQPRPVSQVIVNNTQVWGGA